MVCVQCHAPYILFDTVWIRSINHICVVIEVQVDMLKSSIHESPYSIHSCLEGLHGLP